MSAPFAHVAARSTRMSDRDAIIGARLRDAGGVDLSVSITGNRGGTRHEQFVMSETNRVALIRALGGTP